MNKLAQIIGWFTIALAVLGAVGLGEFRYCFALTGECFK